MKPSSKRTGRHKKQQAALPLYGSIIAWKRHSSDSVRAVIRGGANASYGRIVRFIGVGPRSATEMRDEFLLAFNKTKREARVEKPTQIESGDWDD